MSLDKPSKVAIITGGNTGIGFAIAKRLLQVHRDEFTVVLACRNLQRADDARQKLFEFAPGSDIEIVQVDVESVMSIFKACDEIKRRFTRIDLFFCNAGILLNHGLRWDLVPTMLFTDPVGMLERADLAIQRKGELTPDGLGRSFECNLFGHYMMVIETVILTSIKGQHEQTATCNNSLIREFEDLLSTSGDGRIIWTSSSTSEKDAFNIEDFQAIHSDTPYESSKWATDLTSVYLNKHLAPRNVRSFTTHPGVVASGIGNLALWIVAARTVLHYIFRLCGVTTQTITPANGSLSNLYVALAQPVESLDVGTRYGAHATRMGKPFIVTQPISGYDESVAAELAERMERLRDAFVEERCRNSIKGSGVLN
ncbi:hypothetical protein BC937DRAFT_92587 [Endogone sp. FLAS-F59071]|nr:hypothetical protein BC937DRAFT_92587 [Endogone sp. FLAS-F59071]|eukprot:RUS15325.1 hypothetical protein BC937DRAFT_92587 [Endogone sp. FLAS-F59071]